MGHSAHIVEANQRIGGRIFTQRYENLPAELGGTWFHPPHRRMQQLLQDLNLQGEEQFREGITIQQLHPSFPPQYINQSAFEAGTMRIANGSAQLIQALEQSLAPASITNAWPVKRITHSPNSSQTITVYGPDDQTIDCGHLIIAAPPRNILQHIQFEPGLPPAWHAEAQDISTWMGHSGKCLCWFTSPFWREQGLSGSGFFAAAAVGELHDVSPKAGKLGILMGFINGNHLQASDQAQRSEIIIEQFEQIFPGARQHLLHYDDYLWYDDPLYQSPAPANIP